MSSAVSCRAVMISSMIDFWWLFHLTNACISKIHSLKKYLTEPQYRIKFTFYQFSRQITMYRYHSVSQKWVTTVRIWSIYSHMYFFWNFYRFTIIYYSEVFWGMCTRGTHDFPPKLLCERCRHTHRTGRKFLSSIIKLFI